MNAEYFKLVLYRLVDKAEEYTVSLSAPFTNCLFFLPPGYGLCFLFMAATPVLRSKLSKLVGVSEQGQPLMVYKYITHI